MGFRRIELGDWELYLAYRERLCASSSGASPAPSDAAPAAGPQPPRTDGGSAQLSDRVARIGWYHMIDLGQGIVTPGVFDLQSQVGHYGLPARLDGLRVLDVGTYDGFWAFELERRGAGEVVAIDVDTLGELDLAPGIRAGMQPDEAARRFDDGFRFAHRELGSKVTRHSLNVYDLSPEQLGQFDLVYCGSLLLHLACPLKALQCIRSVVKPGGHAIIADSFHRHVPEGMLYYAGGSYRCIWWYFSFSALQRMIADAGFGRVDPISRFELTDSTTNQRVWIATFRAWP